MTEMDEFSIHTANKGDLTDIDALLGRSYPALLKADYPPSLLVTAIPLIARANPRLVTSGRYFVVRDRSGHAVGAGGWSETHPNTSQRGAPATGHIRHVVTDHTRTRRGIGRALMGHIFDNARAAGIMRLDCFATLTAVPFYAACGFSEDHTLTIELRPGIDFPAVLMHRSL